MRKPKEGDRVRAETKEGVFEGILLPRPKLVGSGGHVLKLDSGYNIGLKREDILELSVVAQAKQKPAPVRKRPKTRGSKKPKVSILSTGGTISSKIDYRSGGVSASFTAEDLLDSMPEAYEHAQISARSIMSVMSEDMTPQLWVKIAREVYQEFASGADGVVVLHGTDTLHYTSAALSFLLPNCPKPVVLTGSQRSTDRGSSDAFLNILCSIITAASEFAGVYLVMHGSMLDDHCLAHNGTRVRKMHTTRRDAFKSINSSPVALVMPDGVITPLVDEYRKRGEGGPTIDARLNPRVGFVKAHPGMQPNIIDYYVKNGCKGIVLEGTALGHVPTNPRKTSLIPSIEAAIDSGVVVCMTTQCLFGRVHPLVYSNLRELSSRGVIYCKDMLPETAYVKLMWVLGHTTDPLEAAGMMLKNYAGEISERSRPEKEFIP